MDKQIEIRRAEAEGHPFDLGGASQLSQQRHREQPRIKALILFVVIYDNTTRCTVHPCVYSSLSISGSIDMHSPPPQQGASMPEHLLLINAFTLKFER